MRVAFVVWAVAAVILDTRCFAFSRNSESPVFSSNGCLELGGNWNLPHGGLHRCRGGGLNGNDETLGKAAVDRPAAVPNADLENAGRAESSGSDRYGRQGSSPPPPHNQRSNAAHHHQSQSSHGTSRDNGRESRQMGGPDSTYQPGDPYAQSTRPKYSNHPNNAQSPYQQQSPGQNLNHHQRQPQPPQHQQVNGNHPNNRAGPPPHNPNMPPRRKPPPPFPNNPNRSPGQSYHQKQHPPQHQNHQHPQHPHAHSPTQPRSSPVQPEANLLGGDTSNLDLSRFDKDVIFDGLKKMYKKKIRPLEVSSKYGHFHSPPLGPSDFDAKPMVLLLGGYSVGKTSFIRYLIGRDFPGQRIGPEPTTDRFTCIMQNENERVVPGAALAAQADRPFRGLSPFGNNFLSRLEGVEMNAAVLKNITLVDTPGVLSGEKQNAGRNYDYEGVMKWFAERADLIIIIFDAHKLDISDELKRVIELMKPHSDKVRVLLNKADMIDAQQLMRVYGALMWSLGKVMLTPEVCRVYIGSFWEEPLQNTEQEALLTSEKNDLFNDIAVLPQNAVMRRINELVKRARSVKVHAYIIHYLRKQLPYTWGKKEKQRRLIDRLDREFVMCARRYELPKGDFPPLGPFKQALLEVKDLSSFQKLDKRLVKDMDKVFSVDIPELLQKARMSKN